MKVDALKIVIACVISALCGLATFSVAGDKEIVDWMSAGAVLSALVTLIPAMAINVEPSRLSINLRLLSWIFFFVLLFINVISWFVNFSLNWYLIVVLLFICIFIIAYQSLYKTRLE